MKKIILLSITISILIFSCQLDQSKMKSDDQLYKLETEYGDMVFKLYDATPLHKENFVKLIEQGYFNDLLFHRVIDGFMIQGGDPDSRNAETGVMLGEGGPGYTIPAEFVDSIFHKKGVIAAAREGDNTNPEMRSAGSQFYIVQGIVLDDEAVKKVEDRINASRLNTLVTKNIEAAKNKAFNTGGSIDYQIILPEARKKAEEEFKTESYYKIPENKLRVYQTIGGTPHLDNAYTVFGEIIEGLEVIDKIASVETDKNDRPLNDIKMRIKKL
ncbi:MAG: peptidylprolyl isomerase [Bacteroidales bacterium]|jgi:cyclophilin family peptidyl-prolyl cis-trans isomerase|nr:peptidylprolyl isomerase [Bacteroidales bacterium]